MCLTTKADVVKETSTLVLTKQKCSGFAFSILKVEDSNTKVFIYRKVEDCNTVKEACLTASVDFVGIIQKVSPSPESSLGTKRWHFSAGSVSFIIIIGKNLPGVSVVYSRESVNWKHFHDCIFVSSHPSMLSLLPTGYTWPFMKIL